MKKVFLYIVISIISLLFISEIVLRVFYKNKFTSNQEFPYQFDSIIGYRFLPNSKGYFRNEAVKNYYYFNSHGFPGDEFSLIKKNGTYRIIIVGSSNEMGFLTNGPLNYIKIIKDSLKNNGINAEIINCSIDGQNRELGKLKFLEKECLKYNPDLVLYTGSFPFNERNRYRTSYKGIKIEFENPELIDSAKCYIDENITHKCLLVKLMDLSYIVRGMCRYYTNKKYVDGKKDHNVFTRILQKILIKDEEIIWAYQFSKLRWRVNLGYSTKYTDEESLLRLKIASSKLSKSNIGFIYYDVFQYNGKTKKQELFSSYGINYLSLNLQFKQDYTFGKKDGHLNQKGHLEIAKVFYKNLVDNIIPEKYFP